MAGKRGKGSGFLTVSALYRVNILDVSLNALVLLGAEHADLYASGEIAFVV